MHLRTGLLVFASGAAVLTLGACGDDDDGDDSSGASTSIEATASEFQFEPDSWTVPAGQEFTIAFENPKGFDLEAGKHQVIFQVFVGVSRKPIREKIFRQLEIRDGRYEVPVRIPPEWIDDSRVSITFVSIQPDHDTWVKAFFHEGKGTGYSGLWTSDGGLLPAIPYASPGAE